MPQNNRNIVIDFISILSLMISCFSLTVIFMDEFSLGAALLFTLTIPFLLISVGKTIHFIYRIVRRKGLKLWEKILVPLFLLICLAYFSPLTPANYQVSQYNPHTRMLAYLPDMDGWRGSTAYVFRDDSTAELRTSYRGDNGSLIETHPYSRKGNTIFYQGDTFIVRNDTLFDPKNHIRGYIEYDKDEEKR